MYTSVLCVIFHVALVFSVATLEHNGAKEIVGKTKIPLEPLIISCFLTDIVIISAPIVAGKKSRYYLTNPQGDVRKLDISRPKYNTTQNDIDAIIVQFINNTKIITPAHGYLVFNVNFGQSGNWSNTEDTFGDKEKNMEANDFMIGPLSEDDYGNWELSALFKDDQGDWAEVYRVITLDIMETVPAVPHLPKLRPGETLQLSFAYPIPNLKTCQLVVPESTFDRFYDRRQADTATCGYVVSNVTEADSGMWRIIGVGRISYHGSVLLTVN